MKRMKLLLLSTLFLSVLSCGQTSNKSPKIEIQSGWKNLDENGYSIQYPENWELNKSGQMGTSFMILSALSSQQDNFRENVNLIIQDLSGQNINLDKYVELSENQVKTMIVNGEILESKRQNINGVNFHKIIFTGKQGIYNLKIEQYYFIEKGKAFILTLTCEISEFEKYKETGEKILNSFKIK